MRTIYPTDNTIEQLSHQCKRDDRSFSLSDRYVVLQQYDMRTQMKKQELTYRWRTQRKRGVTLDRNGTYRSRLTAETEGGQR